MHLVTFFTVCGGGEDYDFLLGSIEHHARLGNHLVLDVSQEQRRFGGLPRTVRWLGARTAYGSGSWLTFRLASALEDARLLALESFPQTVYLVNLDSDEYFDVDVLRPHLRRQEEHERPRVFTFDTIHWRAGRALRFGPSEAHLRAWDIRSRTSVQRNLAWEASPHYNGNPEHHPLWRPARPVQRIHVQQAAHYHLHYALGSKADATETAETTIEGWPNGTPLADPCPWPEPLRKWADGGVKPSENWVSLQ